MIITQIVAASLNNVIGIDNRLPWHMPTDMKWFRDKTWGHHIVTGRRNYEAEGRALPGRTNLVLTRNTGLQLPDAIVFHDIQDAIRYAEDQREKELFIVGGEEIYRIAMPFTDRIYLTRIHFELEGDTYYPEPDWSLFKEVSKVSHKKDAKNPYDFDFITYERIVK